MPYRCGLAIKFSSLLRRCCPLKPGQQTHTQILTHGLMDPTILTDLILMYSRCSQLDTAHQLFDQMPQRTMHSWNILFSSYVQNSLHDRALYLFSDFVNANLTPDHFTLPSLFKACAAMRYFRYGSGLHCWVVRLGLDDHVVVMTSVLDMYVKFECLDDACRVFDAMHKKDVFVWNSMIAGLARYGMLIESVDLFRRMRSEGGEMCGVMAIPSLLSVFGKGGGLRRGKEVHGRVVRCLMFTYDVVVNNSLIEMYAKCGCIDDSHKVFLMMGDQRNLITWSTLISSYGVHGNGNKALSLYNEMIELGFRPNSITFTSILSSCCHSGLVDVGRALFDSMTRDYGLDPSVEHYACMVDLLGRAGCIRDALRLIKGMKMEPTAGIWGALLNACAMHRNVQVAEVAAHKLFKLELRNCSNYIALCGVYEMAGMLDDVATMRMRMRELGMVKTPGCSWIDTKGKMPVFYQGDVHFTSSDRVCEVLDGLCRIMAVGNLRDIDEDLHWFQGT